MSAIASLSRFASLPRLALALVPIALLLAACGGGGPDDAALTTDRAERADRPARSDSADTTDADTPDAGTPDDGQSSEAQQPSETAASSDFPLDRAFVDVIGIEGVGLLSAVSAQAIPPEDSLRGLERSDETPWDPVDLAAELDLIESYQVIYTDFAAESLIVVTIEVARFADAAGAARLMEILRLQPQRPSDAMADLRSDLGLPGAIAIIYDATRDPEASVFAMVVATRTSSVVVAQDNLVLRTIILRGGPREDEGQDEDLTEGQRINRPTVEGSGEAALLARQQLDRLNQANQGDLQPFLFAPAPPLTVDEILNGLPDQIGGLELVEIDQSPDEAVLRYANANGDTLDVALSGFSDVGAIRVTDFAIRQADALLLYTGAGTAFLILDVQRLSAPSLPGGIGTSAHWLVRRGDQTLWHDVLAFRRANVWAIIEGMSVDENATPIVELGFLIDDAISALTGQA